MPSKKLNGAEKQLKNTARPVKKVKTAKSLKPGIPETEMRKLLDSAGVPYIQFSRAGKLIHTGEKFMEAAGIKNELSSVDELLRFYPNKKEKSQLLSLLAPNNSPDTGLALTIKSKEKILNSYIHKKHILPDRSFFIIMNLCESKELPEKAVDEFRYKDIIQTLPVGLYYYELNEKGRLIFYGANKTADQIIGMEHSKSIGLEITDIFPGLAGTDIPRKYAEVARSGKTFRIEQLYYNNGSIKGYYDVLAFQDSPGKMVVAFIEVSDRVESQRTLQASEDRFKSIIENSHAGILVLNDKYKIEYANARISSMLFISQAKLIKKSLKTLLMERDHGLTTDKFHGLFGERGSFDYVINRPGVSNLLAEVNVSFFIDSEGKQKIMLQFLDVTEKKLTEEALKESEERFRSIFNNANIGIYRSTPDGDLLLGNPALLRMYNFSEVEKSNKINIKSRYCDSGDREKFIELMEKEGRVTGYETCWRRGSGEIIKVRENAVAIKDKDGKILYYEGTAEDITATIKAQFIKETLYAISEAANNTASLVDYLAIVREKLKVLIDTTNFYVALYNTATGYYNFPYHKDQYDTEEVFGEHKLKGSLTDYVRRTEKPMLINRQTEEELILKGEVEGVIGTPSPVWLGAPLKIDNEVIGVVAIQNYKSSEFYTEDDLQLLSIIAEQISSAVRKKQTDDKLNESDRKYKNFINQSSEGIWRFEFKSPVSIHEDADYQVKAMYEGFIAECNSSFARMYGYDAPEQMIGKTLRELYGELNEENYKANYDFILNGYKIDNVETVEMTANGQLIYFLNNAVGVIQENKLVSVWGTQRDITELKAAEYALKESEKKFKEMTELMPQVIFETDRNGRLVYSNQKAFDLFELSERNLNGLHIFDFFEEEEAKIIRQNFQYSINFVNDTGREYTAFTKSGRKFPVLVFSSPIIKNGVSEGIRGILVDITERRKIEEQIKESEEKFRSLIENMNEVVYMTDEKGVFTYVSPAVTKNVGYAPEELIGHNFVDFMPPDDALMLLERFQTTIHPGKLTALEYRIYAKDGTLRWVTSSSRPVFQDGKFAGFSGLVTDIHEMKTAVENLRSSEERLRLISEASFEGIIFSEKGVIKDANEQAANIFKLGRSEFIGKNLVDFIDTRIGSRDKLINHIERPEKGVLEHLAYTSLNEPIYVETRGRDFEYSDKNVRIITIRDVTERKIFEKEILKAKEEAEKSDKLKSEFLAQMSHEIRTPVNTVLSFAGLLNEELYDQVGEELRGTFNLMQRAGKRIIRTVDLILNMSQLQTGTYDFAAEEIDITEKLLIPLYHEYLRIAGEKKLDLRLEIEARNLKLLCDEYTVGQIFHNLIDNAIKYTQKGEVKILVGKNSAGKIFVSVEDTGIGISPEYLPNLFRPFTQEEQGYARRFEGNGLGMALVKKYCELNNASISVESKKGEGTKFTVQFN